MSIALAVAAPYSFVFDGQSQNFFPIGPDTYPKQLMADLGTIDGYVPPSSMVAEGGASWSMLLAGTTPGVAPATIRTHPRAHQALITFLVMCGGTQDVLENDTAATIYADMVAYANAARVAGFEPIVATTVPPSTTFSGPQETQRAAANVLILADASNAFDGVADVTVAPLNNPADTTYWNVDGIHWNETGCGLVADIVRAVIEGLIPWIPTQWSDLFAAYDAAVLAASPEAYWPMWNDPAGTVVEALVGTDGTYVNSPALQQTLGGVDHVVQTDGVSSHLTLPFPATDIERELVCPVYLSSVASPTRPVNRDNTNLSSTGTFMAGVPSSGTTTGWWGRARGRDLTASGITATVGWHFHSLFVRKTTCNTEYRIDNVLGQSNGSSNLDAWASPMFLGKNGGEPQYTSAGLFGYAIFPAKLTTPQRDAIYNAYLDILAGP